LKSAPQAPGGLSPRLVALGVVAAGLGLIGLFLAAGFPAERLEPRVRGELASATGAQVRLGSLNTGLSWGGPALTASNVELRWPDGTTLELDRAAIRPAWSLDWLRGVPAWHLDLTGDVGAFRGTLATGEHPRLAGEFRAVVLERIPTSWTGGAQLSGRMDSELDVAWVDEQWAGALELRGRDGSFVIPALPIGVPFQRIDAVLVLGGDTLARLESFVLEGPMIAGSAIGSLGSSAQLVRAALQLDLDLEVRDPNIRPLVEQQGLTLGADGRAHLEVGGTLGAPAVLAPPRTRGRRR